MKTSDKLTWQERAGHPASDGPLTGTAILPPSTRKWRRKRPSRQFLLAVDEQHYAGRHHAIRHNTWHWLQQAELARATRPGRQLSDVELGADHRVERVGVLGR